MDIQFNLSSRKGTVQPLTIQVTKQLYVFLLESAEFPMNPTSEKTILAVIEDAYKRYSWRFAKNYGTTVRHLSSAHFRRREQEREHIARRMFGYLPKEF